MTYLARWPGRHRPAECRPVYVELVCASDGLSHLMTPDGYGEAMVAGGESYEALCGHEVAVCSLSTPPGRVCPGCAQLAR